MGRGLVWLLRARTLFGLSAGGQVINGSVDQDKLHPIAGTSLARPRRRYRRTGARQIPESVCPIKSFIAWKDRASPGGASRQCCRVRPGRSGGRPDMGSTCRGCLRPGVRRTHLNLPATPPPPDTRPRWVAIGIAGVAVVAVVGLAAGVDGGPAPRGTSVRQRLISARINTRAVVAAELIAGTAGLALSLALASWPSAFAAAALVAIAGCVMTVGGLPAWQWAHRLLVWARHRQHRVELLPRRRDGVPAQGGGHRRRRHGVHDDRRAGQALHPDAAVFPAHENAEHAADHQDRRGRPLQRVGLPVDVDIVCEGRPHLRDNYAELYQTSLRGRPAAGQRTVTLVVRFDTRSSEVLPGLMWRKDPVAAAVADLRQRPITVSCANTIAVRGC